MVPIIRESDAGKKPTIGGSNRLATSAYDPQTCTRLSRSRSNPFQQTSARMASRTIRYHPDGPAAPKCSIVLTVRSKTARIREDTARLWRNSCGKGWALAAAPESPGEEYEEYEKYTDQHHVGGGESTALDLLRTLGPALSQNHFSGSGRCCRPR
jgi:hypothetical protein